MSAQTCLSVASASSADARAVMRASNVAVRPMSSSTSTERPTSGLTETTRAGTTLRTESQRGAFGGHDDVARQHLDLDSLTGACALELQAQRRIADAHDGEACRVDMFHDTRDHRTHRIGPDDGAQVRVAAHGRDVALCDNASGIQEHDASSETQHFIELVAHVDDRQREVIAQLLQIGQHVLASRKIERGKRLVEQQQPWLRKQRTAERHALPLAAGELVCAARDQRREA